MLKCTSCLNEQDSGKFCGKCGTSLMENSNHQPSAYTEASAASSAMDTQPVNTNENVMKAKESVSKYWSYALQVLKKPSVALETKENQFVNGVITMALFVIAFALSIYFLANKLYKAVVGGFGSLFSEGGIGAQSLPFFSITSSLLMFAVFFIIGSFISVFLVSKFMSEGFTMKELLGQFGSILIPFTALNVVAIVFGLMGSIQLTLILTGVSMFYTVAILPSIVVYDRAMKSGKILNKLYWATGASAASMFIAYLIVRMSVLDFMSDIESLLNMGF
ncbi:hypothetical protein FGG79_19765 [Bacillus sp. BHET2]|uniref:hypothetical protein n=1 Tax=Bacillus sp. BHET2 TaxID=2583818 RepID=UPI00110E08B3|nr:hypothetical protein [Bacillus sp. BHET2]TMU83448.1 hypothetical protein FGG79_19765 [Bacillus sp. BHET2]